MLRTGLVGLFLLVQNYVLLKFINFSFELPHILLFGFSVWLVLYLLLIKDGKYLEIYEQYKNQRSTLGKLLAWGIGNESDKNEVDSLLQKNFRKINTP